MRILVTGSNSFVATNFIPYVLSVIEDCEVVGVNRDTQPRRFINLAGVDDNRYKVLIGDICDPSLECMNGVDVVVHMAAKTSADHSVKCPQAHIHNNIMGTYQMLERARQYGIQLFLYVSTDEVYGSIVKGAHTEASLLNPGNPYASTKAAGEMLVRGWANTYGIPFIITRCVNCYGINQSSNKALPTFIRHALNNKPLPVFGDGTSERVWMYVGDHCSALATLIHKGVPGEVYNIAGGESMKIIEVAKLVLQTLGKPEDMIEFIPNEKVSPDHDNRYDVYADKLMDTIEWQPVSDRKAMREVIIWYRDNPDSLF